MTSKKKKRVQEASGKRGRATNCTPEVIKIIADEIRLGCSNQDAGCVAGVAVSTFMVWQARGKVETEGLCGIW